MDAGQPGIERDTNNIQIVAIIGNELFFRHPTHSLNLIANARGLFKRQRLAGLFHAFNQLRQDLIVLPGQE
ncbi:hypothetical protein D3C72_1734400 [compost metagenome]